MNSERKRKRENIPALISRQRIFALKTFVQKKREREIGRERKRDIIYLIKSLKIR